MKLFLLTLFFSPLITVGFLSWHSSEQLPEPSLFVQPTLFTVALFWIWCSANVRSEML
jgi:hypothetical protein